MSHSNKNTLRGDASAGEFSRRGPRDHLHLVRPERPFSLTSIEHIESRGRAWFVSTLIHTGILLLLVLVPILMTDSLEIKPFSVVTLAPPPQQRQVLEVTHWKEPPAPLVPKPERLTTPVPEPRLIQPEIELTKAPEPFEKPEIREIAIRSNPSPFAPKTESFEAPAPPRPPVRTGGFGESSANPTVDVSAREVQTGGFGDPNGIRGEGRPDRESNIAGLGSFDLPVGPGAGNGAGGARGVRGTVAGAGFGNGVAGANGSGSGGAGSGGSGGRSVASGGFADATAAAPASRTSRQEDKPAETPVEITSKPRPDYTDEARGRKIEGEVFVRVIFGASGEIRILNVIRGLGHGLDENAVRAAQQIRFKPAQRDGIPVDCAATVHIVFRLAN